MVTEPTNVEQELEISAKKEFLVDHKVGEDDTKTISNSEYKKLDRYQRFEKLFPFYKMDINAYQLLIQTAKKNTYANKGDDEDSKKLFEIKDMSYGALKEVFKPYKSWAAIEDE